MAISKKPRPGAEAKSSRPVSNADSRLDRLRELVKILEASALAELSYEDEDIAVSLHRHGRAGPSQAQIVYESEGPSRIAAPSAPSASAASKAAAAAVEEADIVMVLSPFVGTFYTSSRPGVPAFTEVGAHVRRGQTICIIEAMKLMNEIESEVDGTVVAVLAENAKPVQYGDPLFKIKKG